MLVLKHIFEKEAEILHACSDADTSMFKRPLDSRIFAIKVISAKDCDVLGHNRYAIILADKEGKQIGKYAPIDCGPDSLEAVINNYLLLELDQSLA